MSTPRHPAQPVVRELLRRQLRVVRANEAGCLVPDDIEHVHDYRVAQRRTRVLLRQYRDLLPQEAATLVADLRWIGTYTGTVRDHDVLDARFAELIPRASPRRRAPLEDLRSSLHADRERGRDLLASRLASPRYADMLDRWARLARGSRPSDRAMQAFAVETAPLVVLTFGVLVDAAEVFDEGQTPNETIHRIRIESKKLRYLLEFAASGLEPETVLRTRMVIRRLRALQDRLGAFQDLVVHERTLRDWLARHVVLAERRPATFGTAAALADGMHRRLLRTRRPIGRELRRFTGPWMRRQVRILVGSLR